MKAKQASQLDPVKLIIYHAPHITEAIGYVHPLASLFEQTPGYRKSSQAYDRFVEVLKKYNIHSAEVTDILRRDRKILQELAISTSAFVADEALKAEKHTAISEEYRNQVMNKLDVETLMSIVFSRPTMFLKKDEKNRGIAIERVQIQPLSNMIFIRDQQIVTAKGLVIGNTSTTVRKFEKEVLKKCFEILKIKPVGTMPEDCYLEGGDFMAIRNDLALMQIGIRSNLAGAKYLMDNDLLGTRFFGVVKDQKDRDQQRMHLDTIFNLVDQHHVVLIDSNDPSFTKDIRRDIDVYEQIEGKYQLKQTLDFEQFLVKSGFKVIKCSYRQQQKFMLNFANLGKFDGKYVIVTTNPDFSKKMVENGVDVHVEYIPEFKEVTKMYGAFHCITQIFR